MLDMIFTDKFKVASRILFPPIFCAFLIYITDMSLDYYPLSFGLIIGIANWDLHKRKLIYGVMLSVLVSYISYVIGYFSLAITGDFTGAIFGISGEDARNVLGYIISPFIISPLLLFLLYKIVFIIPKTKLTFFVILVSVIFLVLQSVFFNYYENALSIDLSNNKILNSYTIWQIVMALGIQIILNQKVSERGK